MKLSQLTTHLRQHPDYQLTFVLPDGDRVPAHFHITEAGRIDKSFIDCGATIRTTATCSLQAWVAEDTDHRLRPGKLAGVLDLAAPLFRGDDLDVELEYEACTISQYPMLEAHAEGAELVFQLGSKHTDCLAQELCVPQSATAGCTPGGGCC